MLEQTGIDTQVITLTTPGTHIEEPGRAAELARIANDAFARIVAERGSRYSTLATLPLNEPAASVTEFERATGQLGFRGAMLFSNVNGVALADERFWPLYERTSDKKAVFYIHPTHPVGVEAMTDYWLMPLVGFTMDTTLAAAKLVFSGVARRFRASAGCWRTWAARFPTSPSASTAATRHSASAGAHRPAARARISASSITTR